MSQGEPHWSSEWGNVPDPDTAREEEPKATERDRTSRELQLELDEEMKSLSKGTSGWYYDPEQAQPEWPRDAPFGWGDIKNPFSVVNSDQSTSKSPRKPMKSEQTRLRDPIEGQLELHNEMKSTTWKTSALRYDPTKEEPDWSRDAPFQNVSKPWHYPY
ncbi:uncharacterized protein [Periplaneta americana]|uniref:uncharacterized protein n=1 Tax=Periplaneta americana TaxID=6978 RepID=UPI0037E711E6